MRQSNLYIILYAAAITFVCGGLLAFVSSNLKERQLANVELERKQNILATVITLEKDADIDAIYAERVKERVIDFKGNAVESVTSAEVQIPVEYKKESEERLLPIYEIIDPKNPDVVSNVVMPVYGFGLWNDIWGYIALESDMNTVKGVRFAHKGETPGLGARIDSEDVQERYVGKSIFKDDVLVSVNMQKGEGIDYSKDKHKVDGMSGATLTGKGVNDMLKDYLASYENYLKKSKP